MRRVLDFVRALIAEAQLGQGSAYHEGYIDALEEVEEQITDWMWEEGDDPDEIPGRT